MRLAYYIAVHNDVEQFRWTLSAIYNKDDVFAIHIDRKAGKSFRAVIAGLVKGKRNVHLLPGQTVAWAGWSFCAAELAGLRALLSLDDGWSYFINLSGHCYPVKTIAAIRESLKQAWPKNFIEVVPISSYEEITPEDRHLKRPFVFEFGGKLRFTRFCWPKHPMVIYKGSAWHILSRPFCEWINSEGMDCVPRMLHYMFSPDELLYQLLITNSPFRDAIADHYGREIIWPGPKDLGVDDWPKLSNSTAFFARKFDCRNDARILHKLADLNGFKVVET